MPIRGMWYRYKMQCIEVFLSRAFDVEDRYTQILFATEDERQSSRADEGAQQAAPEIEIKEHDGQEFEPSEDFATWSEFDAEAAEADEALDMLLGYQNIVFRAVYSELNALVELELKNLATSIAESRKGNMQRLNRGSLCAMVEGGYGTKLKELPRFEEVEEVRRIANAFKHDDGFSGTYEEAFAGTGELFGSVEARYKLSWEKAYQSIQAVREFMRALPGDRQEMPEIRRKPEDEASLAARRKKWDHLRRSGALGHDIDAPTTADDKLGGYMATCKLCGKVLRHELEWAVPIIASMGPCPGEPGLRRQ